MQTNDTGVVAWRGANERNNDTVMRQTYCQVTYAPVQLLCPPETEYIQHTRKGELHTTEHQHEEHTYLVDKESLTHSPEEVVAAVVLVADTGTTAAAAAVAAAAVVIVVVAG
jgi:hypothetical protein